MNDVIVQNGKNGHYVNSNGNSNGNIIMKENNNENESVKITIKDIFMTAIKITGLFFWYLLTSFAGIFHKKKKSIRNETVLITGAAGYLGRQLACEFAKQGTTVILWDYNKDENKKTCDQVRALGYNNVYGYQVDLTNETEVRDTAAKVKNLHGFISMIVLAAAIPCEVESVFSMRDSEKLNKTFKLFYESHLWMYQEFLPKMIEKNHGHVVVVSSETVFTKLAFIHTYSGMKAAQAKLFECVDAELNYSIDNKIKTSLVYLGGLRRGISTSMIKKFLINNPLGEKYIDKFGLSNEYASRRIVKSVLKNEKYIYLPLYVYLIVIIKYFLPTACSELLLGSRNFINNKNLLVYQRDVPKESQESTLKEKKIH